MLRFAIRFPRVFTSVWFAAAGGIIPAVWAIPTTLKEGDVMGAIVYGLLPPMAAAIADALFGTPILHSADQMTARRAIGRGVGVGVLAVVIFSPLYALCYTAARKMGLAYVPAVTTLVALGGIFVVGLPIACIAGTAGWLLYRLALHADRVTTPSEHSE